MKQIVKIKILTYKCRSNSQWPQSDVFQVETYAYPYDGLEVQVC